MPKIACIANLRTFWHNTYINIGIKDMRLYQHVIASGIISGGIYVVSGSPALAVSSCAAGFLVDVDHLFDYWKQHPLSFDIPHFFRTCNEYQLKKAYLLFHSWELLLLAALVAYLSRSVWVVGIALGLIQHMAFDQICNKMHPFSYFLIYRIVKQFKAEAIFDLQSLTDKSHGKN
jgi:hypothetical protein